MTLGHALPAITFVSFVCNKYEFPNSNRCYMETRKQANGQLVWFDMCCPVGCVFKNCKCLPAGLGPHRYNQQSIAKCTRGIRRVRHRNAIRKLSHSGHHYFGKTGTPVHNLGIGSNRYQFGNRKYEAYRKGRKYLHTSGHYPKPYVHSRHVGHGTHYFNSHNRRPILRYPTRIYHHNKRILHKRPIYETTYSDGGFRTLSQNRKYIKPKKKYQKRKLRYGRYGEKMDRKNYLKFKKNLQRANGYTDRITTDYSKTETYVKNKDGGDYRHDGTGHKSTGKVDKYNQDSMKMRKYGDNYGTKRQKTHVHTHDHGAHHHTHHHHHDHKHHHHHHDTGGYDKTGYVDNKNTYDKIVKPSGTNTVYIKSSEHGKYTGPGYTETRRETAAARKETVEIIDTSGVGGVTENQINDNRIGGSDAGGVFIDTGKNVKVDATFVDNKDRENNINDGLFTSRIVDSGSVNSGDTLVDRTIDRTSEGIDGGNTLLDRTSEARRNIVNIDISKTDASSSGVGGGNTQIGATTHIGGTVGKFKVDHTSEGIGGGNTLIDRTSETRGNVGNVDVWGIGASSIGGGNSQTGATTDLGGDVGKFEVDHTIDHTFEGIGGGNALVDRTLENQGNVANVDLSKIDTSSSGIGGGNSLIGDNTRIGGNVNRLDGSLVDHSTDHKFEGTGGGNTFIGKTTETRGGTSFVNTNVLSGENTNVDNSNKDISISSSSNTREALPSTSVGNKVIVDQSHTRTTKIKITDVRGDHKTDSSTSGTKRQIVFIGKAPDTTESGSIDSSSVGIHRQNVLIDESQSASIGGTLTNNLEVNKAGIRDGTTIFETSGRSGISGSTDTSSSSQHVKIIEAVDNSIGSGTGKINTNNIRDRVGSSSSINAGNNVVDNAASSIVTDADTSGGIVINAIDNIDGSISGQTSGSLIDATFPVIGGSSIGRTAEQRRVEVIQHEETYLSPDICIECEIDDGGIGYIHHPEHCDMFVMCIPTIDGKMTPVSQVCPHGQYWDQLTLTCRPSQLTICPLDVCYKRKAEMEGRTHAHRSNCRSYWECSNGYSLEKCCPPGQSYRANSGCVPDKTCQKLCGQELEKPYEPNEQCKMRAVSGKPRKYEWDTLNGWTLMNCAPGTIFHEQLCECVYFDNPIPGTKDPVYDPHEHEQAVCTPDVHLPFDDFLDHSGKNTYVYSSNVTLDGYGAGCFNGHSAISLPMFTNMNLGHKLFVKITYKQPFTTEHQALLYNGDCMKDPSLVLTSATTSNHLHVTSSYNETSKLDLMSASPANDWRHMVININGKELNAKTDQGHARIEVEGLLNEKTDKSHGRITVEGGIARTQCGLKIGWGKDYPGFVGCIDDFILYRCFPGKI